MTSFSHEPPPGYTLLEKVGQGGMGTVYRAKQTSLKRIVALKVLNDESNMDEQTLARFEREAALHMELSHPNLTQVFDAGVVHGQRFLAMEFVPGQTLKERIEDRGPFPPAEALRAGYELFDVLEFLHSRGVIHRDIKPGNILVDERGSCKLTDLGLARKQNQTIITEDDSIIGTFQYLAPEVFLGDRADEPADVYALGIVLFEMLTETSPYLGLPLRQVAHDVIAVSLPRISVAIGIELPEHLEQFVIDITSKEAKLRPTARAAFEQIQLLTSGPTDDAGPDPFSASDSMSAPSIRSESSNSSMMISQLSPSISWTGSLSLGGKFSGIWERGVSPMLIGLIGLALGFGLGVSSLLVPANPNPEPSLQNSGLEASRTPLSSENPGSENPSSAAEIQLEMERALNLLIEYKETCRGAERDEAESFFRNNVVKDWFHRRHLGKLDLLFRALSTCRDIIRLAQESEVKGPIWFDIHQITYGVTMEAARSHGFDSTSLLHLPLKRLQESIPPEIGDPFRDSMAFEVAPIFEHMATLDTKFYWSRIEFIDKELNLFTSLPEEWRESPRGRYEVFNSLNHAARLGWQIAEGVIIPGNMSREDIFRDVQLRLNAWVREKILARELPDEPYRQRLYQSLIMCACRSIRLVEKGKEIPDFVSRLLDFAAPHLALSAKPGLTLVFKSELYNLEAFLDRYPTPETEGLLETLKDYVEVFPGY